jgi:hypothetical protein
MTRRRIARAAVAGAIIGFSALATTVQASADPVPPPGDPAAPGQVLIDAPAADALAAPAPGPPPVPEIANPKYGSGHSNGPLGFLRDAWHQAQDPYNFAETPDGQMPGGAPPPAGAGPAPQLPPGFKSLNAPGSEAPAAGPASDGGPASAGSYAGGPPPPPGYYPLNGPPPPAEYFNPPAAPPGAAAPGPIHATNLPPE